jgi:hypothetical protein
VSDEEFNNLFEASEKMWPNANFFWIYVFTIFQNEVWTSVSSTTDEQFDGFSIRWELFRDDSSQDRVTEYKIVAFRYFLCMIWECNILVLLIRFAIIFHNFFLCVSSNFILKNGEHIDPKNVLIHIGTRDLQNHGVVSDEEFNNLLFPGYMFNAVFKCFTISGRPSCYLDAHYQKTYLRMVQTF